MTQPRRVLVVEDDPIENEFFSLTARGLGFIADSAFDGQQALDMAGKNKPSLVLLDSLLPKVDGFAVLAEFRQRMPDVPVVMMSGIYKKRTYETEALRQGAAAYVVKPLSVVTLWDVLERHLGASTAPSQVQAQGVPFWRRPLPAVVGDLHAQRKTGLLFARSEAGAAIFFFEDGVLVFARCNDPATRLERVLVQMGKVPESKLAALEEVLAASKGLSLGERLVQDGLLSEDVVREALVAQQRAHLSSPFSWTEGSCHFFPTEAPRNESLKMPVDVPALVFWGCRNLPVDERLLSWLPATNRKPTVRIDVAAVAQRFRLSAEECQFISLMDGTRTVGQLRSVARALGVDGERLLAGLQALQALDAPPVEDAAAPQGMAGAPLPQAGDLARFSPALLLVMGALARKTGVLEVEAAEPAGQTRTLWLENGAIAFVSSNDPADRLGQVLLREGLLTAEQLQQALTTAQQRPGTALGRVLVDLGFLDPDALHRGLVVQAQHGVAAILGLRAGTFTFTERSLPPNDIVPLGLDTREALMRAFRTCAFEKIAYRIPQPQTRLRRSGACQELAANLPLTVIEERVLQEAACGATIEDVASRWPEGAQPALRAVHALLSMGLLEGIASPVPSPAAVQAAAPAQAASDEAGGADLPFDEDTLPPLGDGASPFAESFGSLEDALLQSIAPGAPAAAADPATATAVASPPREAFALATPPASARASDFDLVLPLDGGLEEALLSGPSPATQEDAWPALARDRAARAEDSSGGAGTAVATAPAATLVAPPPPSAAAQVDQLVQLSRFFELLSAFLRTNPGKVPDNVLAAIPADLRQIFRL